LHIPLLLNIASFVPSLVAISSFLASAYTLYFLPLPPQKVGILTTSDLKARTAKRKGGGGYGFNTPSSASATQAAQRRPVPYLSDEVTEVLAKYIVSANAGICLMLVILEFFSSREWSESLAIGGGFLPGFVLSVVLWARNELRVVDMGELEKLKFASKGK
jgi:hypothetical protein